MTYPNQAAADKAATILNQSRPGYPFTRAVKAASGWTVIASYGYGTTTPTPTPGRGD